MEHTSEVVIVETRPHNASFLLLALQTIEFWAILEVSVRELRFYVSSHSRITGHTVCVDSVYGFVELLLVF